MSNVLRFTARAAPPLRRSDRSAAVRVLVEDEIERLIGLLDVIDGDPEAEDDGAAEPSLGWTLTMAHGTTDDREEGVR